MTSRDQVVRPPTRKQLEAQRAHVMRARRSLRKALEVADCEQDIFVMRALAETARYMTATRT
jgi:hypothetical protein